jgi:Nif11 domain
VSTEPQSLQRRGPGVATALRFLAAARTDAVLRERLTTVTPEVGLAPVIELAAEAGFEFAPEDLRAAFTHDWAFRRALYLREPPASDSAASTVAVVNSPSSST